MESFIKLCDICKYYNSHNHINMALNKINLKFNLGEFVAVTGDSGSGKSTLLNVLANFDTYEEGEMYFNGENTLNFTDSDWEKYRNDNIAFIYQDYKLIENYTVYQNLELVLIRKNLDYNSRKKRIRELLEKVELTNVAMQKTSTLSGGQKQRVAIARALAQDCPVILADEPCGNLDSENTKKIIKLLAEVSKNKLIIMITHDFEEVQDYVSRKIRIYDGRVDEDIKIKKYRKAEFEKDNKVVSKKDKLKTNFKFAKYIAKNNFFSTPKKSVFLIAFLIILSLSCTLCGTLITNLFYLKEATLLGMFDKNNVLVYKANNENFSEADINYFKNNKNVRGILNNKLSFNADVTNLGIGKINPDFVINKSLIKYGRLPENNTEFMVKCNSYYFDKQNLNKSFMVKIIGDNSKTSIKSLKLVGFCDCETLVSNKEFIFDENSYNTMINNTIKNNFNDIELEMFFEKDKSYKINCYDKNVKILENGFSIMRIAKNKLDDYPEDKYSFVQKEEFLNHSQKSSFEHNFIQSTQKVNAKYYNLYYKGTEFEKNDTPLFLVSYKLIRDSVPKLIFYKKGDMRDEYSVYLKNANIDNFRSAIKKDNFKSRYFYGAANMNKNLIFRDRIVSYLTPLILITIFAYTFMRFIVNNILKSKNNTFSLLRSLGISKKTIVTSLFIELFAVSLIILTVVLFVNIPIVNYLIVSKSQFMDNTLYPFGLRFDFMCNIFIYAYLFQSIITIVYLRFFVKRMFKKSIKKMEVEG